MIYILLSVQLNTFKIKNNEENKTIIKAEKI